jgi:hypothetical protein
VLKKLLVEKHPDKTFIGKAVRGFDFLGYFLKPGKLAVADKTISNMVERVVQLYEQDADLVSIGQYLVRWRKWAVAGIRTLARDEYDFFGADTKKTGRGGYAPTSSIRSSSNFPCEPTALPGVYKSLTFPDWIEGGGGWTGQSHEVLGFSLFPFFFHFASDAESCKTC